MTLAKGDQEGVPDKDSVKTGKREEQTTAMHMGAYAQRGLIPAVGGAQPGGGTEWQRSQ